MKCLTCNHCRVHEGWRGTEVTPGEPMYWFCSKNVWTETLYGLDKEQLVDAFIKGETCTLWEPDEAELRRRART